MKSSKYQRSASRNKRGAVLVIVLLVVSALAIAAGSMQMLARSSRVSQQSSMDRMQAHYLAEAALKHAFVQQNLGNEMNLGSGENPVHFRVGDFWVNSSAGADGQTEMVAFASVGQVQTGIQLDVQINEGESSTPLFGVYGIFGKDGVIIDHGTRVFSYDSSSGGGCGEGEESTVGSNGSIEVKNGGRIFGDATAGPGCSVTIASGAAVSGSASAASSELILPTVEVPSFVDSGPRVLSGTTSQTLASGDYHFSHMGLTGRSKVTIQGPATVVLDSFSIARNCQFLADTTNGPVAVYCTGNFIAARNSDIDNTSDVAADFQMYIMGDNVDDDCTLTLSTGAEWHGVIYAPYANIVIDHGTRVWGGIVARSVKLLSGSRVYQDVAATSLTLGSQVDDTESSSMSILGWRGVTENIKARESESEQGTDNY